ncbi:DNA cytosine methyltransferase [Suttonella ornithocola]|uniref:DNA (cytosine-5-)-methyltransferase n=1 Tax=Suttonella ornithocola TaxID=279832 RepID=A0A380MXF5_9GAMM|nr:DNA cytosine methyltransferase [Suttonella ornithocola]SUO96716.1 Modification methylase HaeIII [Suttonella ornithocola]
MRKIEAVDLFCGAGVLTAGLMQAGINVKAGYDIESCCAYAYEYNNPGAKFILKDVQHVTAEEILSHYSDDAIRLLAGCAPCQPFSTYNQGRDTKNDKKWPLLYAFARLIRETKPHLVTMENVPDVTKHEVYQDFVKNLENIGYKIWANTVLCADYGIPQMRRRHVLLASRIGKIELLAETHKNKYRTVRDAIGDLPPLMAGERSATDNLHRCAGLSEINLKRIRASKPGGTWMDWPEELRAACHRKESGQSYKRVYGRMEWDKPAPTITTLCYGFGNGRFGHPEQDRAISLREAAIFQSFPIDYQFFDPTKTQQPNISIIGRMIGNAVPVGLGTIVGKSLNNIVS